MPSGPHRRNAHRRAA